MTDILTDLYAIIENRKAEKEEGSYTAYLFEAGLDKILKKVGEESAETIIAAKTLEAGKKDPEKARDDLINEIGDLIYHLVILCSELGVRPEEVEDLLRGRMKKTGNLRAAHETDKNT